MSFVHLHTHSHYSLLDGAAKIDALVEKAKSCEMPALALTDHGVMYGAIELYQKAVKAGVKPIIGVEVYLAATSRHDKTNRPENIRHHLILLAKNETGYKNLLKMTSIAHLEGFYYKPRIDWETLKKYKDGLIASTACIAGELPRAIRGKDEKKADSAIQKYLSLFGDDFYLEIQRHPNLKKEYDASNKGLIELSKKHGIPIIAANDSHFLNREDEEAQDVLLCLQMKKKKNDTDRMMMTGGEYFFKNPAEMKELFYDHPEAISNTLQIAQKCNLNLEFGKINLPHFEIPEQKTADNYLRELCISGISKRYPEAKEGSKEYNKIIERLDYELGIIGGTGFASYFLIVQDFVNWAKNEDIVVGPGRGSAAGSLASYLLRITNVDPLKYNLLFERFLNPERVEMPDIDLDFADTRRDEVIRYVEKKYGRDKVAQIITFGTMAARAAIRDVGRVLDISYTYCDGLAKMIPAFTTLSEALENVQEVKEIYAKEPDAKKILDTAKTLEGVARHSSTHACAVLITKDPLDHYVPLQYVSTSDKTVISQYSMKPSADLGLLKMDFLGLKNLTIIENALRIIKKIKGEKINIDEISVDDKNTFRLFQRGDTTGVFQFESSGMKRYLKLLAPTNMEDIIAMVALYRPGPMEWIPDFVDRKHGRKKIAYLHPKLEPILKDTYGVAIYQEQVMRIARDLAGFTLGEADVLRKAMGKKIVELLAKQKQKFIQGCVKNGIAKKMTEQIFAFIEPFAGYGFNRSHAACYALIGYQTAYLKANYPLEFATALLSAHEGDIEKVAKIVQEIEESGIKITPPDINKSFEHFTANPEEKGKGQIVFGLKAIKNVGSNIVSEIIKRRKEGGEFKNLTNFLERTQHKDLNKKSIESLTKCGALDQLGERGQILANLEKILNYARDWKKQQESKQSSLFGGKEERKDLPLDPAPEALSKDKLSWEKELLGLYVSDHPMSKIYQHVKNITTPISRITASNKNEEESQNEESAVILEKEPLIPADSNVIVSAVIGKIKKIITKKGDSMLFANIEDMSGVVEILVFPKTLEENPELWQEEKQIIMSGRITDKDGTPKLITNKALPLEIENLENAVIELKKAEEKKQWNKENGGWQNKANSQETQNQTPKRNFIDIRLNANLPKEKLKNLKELLLENGGNHKVRFIVSPTPASAKVISTSFFVAGSEEMREKIEAIAGSGVVMVR